MSRADDAIALEGVPVFPAGQDKRPLTAHGFKDATTDPRIIRGWWSRWPDALIGRPTGAVSGVVVIDVDVDIDKAIDGADALAALESSNSPLPITWTARTPRGGTHYYFRHPGGTVPCSASRLGRGIDVRGDGGYVIAPPSSLSDGRRYEWLADGDPEDGAPLADLPAWLARLLVAQERPQTAPPADGVRILDGARNDTLFRMGRSLRAKGLTHAGIHAALLAENAARCDPPLEDAEVDVIARQACKVAPGRSPEFDRADSPPPREEEPPPLDDGDPGPWQEGATKEAGAAPAEEPTGLCVVDMGRLFDAELPRPSFVVDPLIPRGYLTLFGGHGGSGKTSVALVLAAHVACGRNWAGLDVQKGAVLFVSFEDRQDLVLWRLRNIADEYALNMREIAARVCVIDATEAAPIVIEASDGGIRRVVASRAGESLVAMIRERKPDLTIIDNASDAYDGDENNRRQVRSFIRYLAGATKDHDGAVVLLAHIDKNSAKFGANRNSYSGSTGWHNTARSRLALVNDELHQEKLNVGKALAVPVALTWTTKAVPRVAQTGGTTATQDADDAALLACFAAAEEAGQTVSASETGPNAPTKALTIYPECPSALRKDKERLREGIARLLRAGKIVAEDYRDHFRKPRSRLVLSATVCDSSNCRRTNANHRTPCDSSEQGVRGESARAPTERAELSHPVSVDADPLASVWPMGEL